MLKKWFKELLNRKSSYQLMIEEQNRQIEKHKARIRIQLEFEQQHRMNRRAAETLINYAESLSNTRGNQVSGINIMGIEADIITNDEYDNDEYDNEKKKKSKHPNGIQKAIEKEFIPEQKRLTKIIEN